MKGIILAGDSGSSLHPLTVALPKQLLPIYDRPMIFYPIETLVQAGIYEILIITTQEHQSLFKKTISNLSFKVVHFSYAIQNTPEGIAQAISIGKEFIGKESVCLITGDTIIIENNISKKLRTAIKTAEKSGNATIFVKRDWDSNQYGKVILNTDGTIHYIGGNVDTQNYYSITGLYVFPNSVIQRIDRIEPSERGRFEITSINKLFFEECKLQIQKLNLDCMWFDTNTFDNLLTCSKYMQQHKDSIH